MQNRRVKALLSHKASLENIFEALPALVYCKDTECRVIYVNEELADKFDKKKADFEGQLIDELFPPSDAHLMGDDADIMKTGIPQKRMFLSYETPAGKRWAHAYKLPFRDTDGKIIGMIGFAIDITEIKQMQDNLKKNEKKFRNYFETSKDCIYITSFDGKILEINNAAAEMFGYAAKDELMGIPVQALYINPDDREALQAEIRRKGIADKLSIDLKRKDGSVVHSLLTALPVQDDNGKIYGYQGTIHDITALKEAEAQKNLLEAELRQAQKMEAIAKLSGGIAHDFNNLLFTIMGSIELALNFTDMGQAKQLDRAYRACLEAKQLIRRFLELSESPVAAKAQGSIAELIQEAVSPRIGSSQHIHYEIQIDGGLFRVVYVYDQMLQAMENLLSNAEEALAEGGTIKVAAKNTELDGNMLNLGKSLAPGKYLEIIVSDNGVGIPPADIEKVFDPYFSTHKHPSSKGHGLGLTTVYATVKRHKGDILVDSKPGAGTAVTLYLPAAEL